MQIPLKKKDFKEEIHNGPESKATCVHRAKKYNVLRTIHNIINPLWFWLSTPGSLYCVIYSSPSLIVTCNLFLLFTYKIVSILVHFVCFNFRCICLFTSLVYIRLDDRMLKFINEVCRTPTGTSAVCKELFCFFCQGCVAAVMIRVTG